MKVLSLACLLVAGASAMQLKNKAAMQYKEEVKQMHVEADKFANTHVGEHYAAVDQRLQTMSNDEALNELRRRGVSDDLLVMMQDLISTQKPLPPSTIGKAFKNVVDKINEMISFVQMEYDVAELTCRSALEDLRSEINAEQANMDTIEAHMGETQSFLIDWNNRKDEAEKNIKTATEQLESHKAWCEREVAATQEVIRINTQDYEQANMVYTKSMEKCVEKAASQVTGDKRPADPVTSVNLLEQDLDRDVAAHTEHGEVLLRCVNWMGRSFITFEKPEIAKAVLSMSHARHSKLHRRLTQAFLGDDALAPVEVAAPQSAANSTEKKEFSPLTIEATSGSDPVGLIIPDALKNAGCTDSIGNMTSDKFKEMCVKVKESIAELVDQVKYELNLQKQYLAETRRNCSHIEKELNEELEAYNEIKGTAESRIAMLTARYTQLQSDSRTALANYEQRKAEFASKLDTCKVSFSQAITGACAAKKIKKEITAISVAPINPIIECQVTAWNEPQAMCSANCGKEGVKTLSRTVTVDPTPVWGAPCPALTAERVCNRVTCPVDCVVGSWNPFTPCSAKCNVGTKFRYKDVIVEPRYKGQACGDVEGLEFCNQEACDQDCDLYAWTDFTPCDRACNAGHKTRSRPIKKEKKGDGYCPPILDDRRLEIVKCNTQRCPDVKPVCESKLDVILLIDTSGSIGQDGFAASKQFAKNFVNQMTLSADSVAVGVIAFSDKPTIVMPLNYTRSEVLASIDSGILWDAGLTCTASALTMAGQLLDNGARPGAMPVVIVVTDGMPTGLDPDWNEWWDTPGNAEGLRRRARLMFLAVGSAIEEADMMSWATDEGKTNNYAHIQDYTILTKALDELIITTCPEIGTPSNSFTQEQSGFLGRKPVLVDASMRAQYNHKGVMWGSQRKVFLATQSDTNPLADVTMDSFRY